MFLQVSALGNPTRMQGDDWSGSIQRMEEVVADFLAASVMADRLGCAVNGR